MKEKSNAIDKESVQKHKLDLFLKNFRKNWELFKANKAGYYSLWGILFFIFLAILSAFIPLLGPEYNPLKAEETLSKVVLDISNIKNEKANTLILKDWDLDDRETCERDLRETFTVITSYEHYLNQSYNELLARYNSFFKKEKKFREKYEKAEQKEKTGAFSLILVLEDLIDNVEMAKDSYKNNHRSIESRSMYQKKKDEYLSDNNRLLNDRQQLLGLINSAKAYTTELNNSAKILDMLRREIGNYEQTIDPFPRAPSLRHWLGQDNQGRDLLCQLLVGASMAIRVGVVAAFSAVLLGTLFGLLAGYYGGGVDTLIMRVVDILMCLPSLALAIIIAGVMGGLSIWNIIILIGVFSWSRIARVIRAQTLTLKTRPYIESAKVSGASNFRIIFRHIGPNVLPFSLLYMAFLVSSAILFEGALSFLGFGDSTQVSWGMMLQWCFTTGSTFTAPYWLLPPGIAISLMCLCFYLVGRACDEIVNPKLRRRG